MASLPEWLQVLLGAAAGGAGVYAAIRADLAALQARATNLETHAAEARTGMRQLHERIDNVFHRGMNG